MVNCLKCLFIVAIGALGYYLGYTHAEDTLNAQFAEEVLKVTKNQRIKYEEEVKQLTADLESVRANYDKRMQQLNELRSKERKSGNSCSKSCDALGLAIRCENLLDRADKMLESIVE